MDGSIGRYGIRIWIDDHLAGSFVLCSLLVKSLNDDNDSDVMFGTRLVICHAWTWYGMDGSSDHVEI